MQIGRRGVDIFRPHPSDAAPPPVRRDCSAIFRSRRADADASPASPAPRDGEEEDVVVSSLPGPTPPVWPPAEIAGCLSDSTSASGQARRTSRGRRARILGRGRSLRSASGSGSVSPGKKGPRRPSYYRIELDGESERARLEYLEDSSVTVPPGGDRSDLLRVATPRRRGDGTAAAGLSRAGPVSSRSASGGEQGQRAGEGSGEAPAGPGHVWTVSGTGKIVALPVREEDREAGADAAAAAAVSKSAVPSAVPSRDPTKGGAPGPPPSSPVPLLCKASMSDDDDSHGSDDGSLTFSEDGKGRSSTPPCAGATPPASSASSSGGDEYDIVSPPRLGRSAGLLAFHPGSASAYPAAGGGVDGHDPAGGMRTAIEGEIRDRIAGKQGGAVPSSSGSARSSGTSPSSAHSDRGGCEGGMIAAILEMLSWNACCRYGGQDGPGGDGMAGVCQS